MRQYPLLILAVLGLTTLNGCTTLSRVDIQGKEGHARFPEGEITVALDEVDRSDPKRRYNELSLGYVRTRGDSKQTLGSNDYAGIDGKRINGPTQLNNSVELEIGHLRFIRHIFFNQKFELHWGAGLGYSDFTYRGTTTTQQLTLHDSALGLHGLIGLAYYLAPRLSIEGRIAGYVFSSDHDSQLTTGQVGFAVLPIDALRLFAGYRRWNFDMQPSDSISDIDYTFSGPTLALTVNF